jgi:leucyl aminopeptidase
VTTITLSSSAPTKAKVDALVVGVTKDSDGPVVVGDGLDGSAAADIQGALRTLRASGKADEVVKIPSNGASRAPLVVAVGLGATSDDNSFAPETLRRAAGAATRALAGSASVGIALPAGSAEAVAAVAEGALMGAYAFDRYRTNSDASSAPVAAVTVFSGAARDKGAKAALPRAEALAEAVALARDLINMPASDLTPAEFVRLTSEAVKGTGVKIEVLDEKALVKGGYGGIMGVGQGSTNPPRLLRVAYRSGRSAPHLALVGKGITFDSGGLSLKPNDGMVTMKCDMSGAAAVVAAVLAVARTKPSVNVTAWACLAENMPSGTAQRPSDVLRMYGGKTVEVLNTDAEGRLVLADGIVRASEENPDVIVDVATLTGACVVALGGRTSGIMTHDKGLREAVQAAAERAGESMWPLPITEESRPKLDSPIADIANVGDRWGGALTAAAFLAEFVPEGRRWAHLDIAGPAFNDKPYGYTPKGGTGAAVRTLVALAEDMAAGKV